jgi:hypothetical protein
LTKKVIIIGLFILFVVIIFGLTTILASASWTSQVTTTHSIYVNITPIITWSNPANITYGAALTNTQLDATSSVSGTFAYNPVAGTVLSAGTHILTATFTSTYTTATDSVLINVTQATPAITWSNPGNITYGTALSSTQLDANASVPGTFVYNPPSGTVLSEGTHILTATFTPTDTANYTTATTNVSINVTRVTPIITWSNPANITYGTALTSTQLDTTSSVPGTFAYNPPSGTVLSEGTHVLTATFTPTDTTATDSVLINVIQATPAITWSNPGNITYGTALSSTQLDANASVPGTYIYTPPSVRVNMSNDGVLCVLFGIFLVLLAGILVLLMYL